MYYTDHYFMQFSTMPQGWVANGSDFSAGQLAALNNQERLLMGWIPKESEKGNLCRFTFGMASSTTDTSNSGLMVCSVMPDP